MAIHSDNKGGERFVLRIYKCHSRLSRLERTEGRRMSGKQCPKCKIIGINVPTVIGELTQCPCLPAGKTCKDCKFESQCLIEGVIKGPETYCKMFEERGFAEPGQLSYHEKWEKYWAEQKRLQQEKERREYEEILEKRKAHQRALVGHIYTEQMILEGILPHRLRKVYTALPPGKEPDNEVGWYFQTYLDKYSDPLEAARAYCNVHMPRWKRLVGERLPEHLKGAFRENELAYLESLKAQVKVLEITQPSGRVSSGTKAVI
jgi:hypothetical protein